MAPGKSNKRPSQPRTPTKLNASVTSSTEAYVADIVKAAVDIAKTSPAPTVPVHTDASGPPVKLLVQVLIVLMTLLLRWCVSVHSYSGQGKPAPFGDYEAQRHWMEICYHLPVAQWYINDPPAGNDLLWWGLDYPPLTAYHSAFMGYVAHRINPQYVALVDSRGFTSYEHKIFMRATVWFSDILVFYPSVFLLVGVLFARKKQPEKQHHDPFSFDLHERDHLITLVLVFLNPTLMLVDHGHFQYNCVSLGLMQLAVYWIVRARGAFRSTTTRNVMLMLAAVFFTLALNYKQMELYHALPFFFYLLGVCWQAGVTRAGGLSLALIGLAVIGTFGLAWWPFLGNLDLVLQVLHRCFPFSRGLFEDKVANVWCSLSVLIKVREIFTIATLSKLSLATTTLLNLPSGLHLLRRPNAQRFILALINSSLVFYLFSFQVHEKSILLATVPACLLVSSYPLLVTWFLVISQLSMLPLFVKDGLVLAYISTTLMFVVIVNWYFGFVTTDQRKPRVWPKLAINNTQTAAIIQQIIRITFIASMFGAFVLSIVFVFVRPPSHLPDLWTVAICVYCCAHFILFTLLFHLIQFTLRDDTIRESDPATRKSALNFTSFLATSSDTIKSKEE